MSIAAMNFLSQSRFTNKIVSKDDDKDDQKSKEPKLRRTGKTACPRKTSKKRYSLCNMEYDNMCQYINYFTQTKMKESNIINILKNQIGNLENSSTVSPVLEQTSIGDFLRVVNSLHSTSNYYTTAAETRTQRNESSPLFTLFQNETTKPTEFKEKSPPERRYSVNRRYSLALTSTSHSKISRNKSFSTNVRKISPSRFVKERTYSNPALSFPQIRRIRSESISEDQPEVPVNTLKSRKIRRFSVKPVSLSGTMPEIVVDECSEKAVNQNDVEVHADGVSLESVKIEK